MFEKMKGYWTVAVEWWQHPKVGWFSIVLLMAAALVTVSMIGWLWLSQILYVVIGFGISVFYGLYAMEVFTDVKREGAKQEWVLHQMWFNFLCSVVGWVSGYYLVFCRMTADGPVGLLDLVFSLVAVLGMTGHLPMTVYTIPKMTVEWLGQRLGIDTNDGKNERTTEKGDSPQ